MNLKKTLIPPLVAALALLLSGFGPAGAVDIKPAKVNQELNLVTADRPLIKDQAPAKLWGRFCRQGRMPYVTIYHFRVEVGQRYTLELEYPGDGNQGHLYLTGDNPLTDDLSLYGPKAPKQVDTARAFPRGFSKDCNFLFRHNFTVSKTSIHNSMWLVAVSRKPGATWQVTLRQPAEAELRVKNDTRARCPGEKPIYRYGKIHPDPVWLGFDPSEVAAGKGRLTEGLNLSGSWEAFDAMGRPLMWLTLHQVGINLTGQVRYDAGTAAVTGFIEGYHLYLRIKYQTPPLLANWLPARVARQVLGISTQLVFKLLPGANELQGQINEFAVVWDGSHQVIARYEGGSPEAKKLKKPKPVVIRRSTKTGTGFSGPSLAGGIWLEAEAEAAFQIMATSSGEQTSMPHSGTGYWYMSKGGDWLLHIFQVAKPGIYYLWLKDYSGGMHPPAARALNISVDCHPLGAFPAHRGAGKEGWAWHKVAQLDLKEGMHFLKIQKDKTSLAPAMLDVIFLTPDAKITPPDKRDLGG